MLHETVTAEGSRRLHRVAAVIFDGDDTLWFTEELYDAARDESQSIVERAGLDGERWSDLQKRIDLENVKEFGHSPDRFPTSSVQALDRLTSTRPIPTTLEAELRRKVWQASASVFSNPAQLREDSHAVIEELKEGGIAVALLTKGPQEIQKRRIEQSGLGPLFSVIRIVDTKSPADFSDLADTIGAVRSETVSVGNSVRSDVLPAIAAGLQAVWLPAHVWEYERRSDDLLPGSVASITSLSELLPLLN